MLTWNTQFSLDSSKTVEDFIDSCKHWLTGSPRREWSEEELETPSEAFVVRENESKERVTIMRHQQSEAQWVGFEHFWVDADGQAWRTVAVAQKTSTSFICSVQLFSETSRLGKPLVKPKKPYLVRLLVDQLGGVYGDFPIQSKPLMLQEPEIGKAAKLMKGDIQHSLPVVYVSKDWDGSLLVDTSRLAEQLSGVAHVVIEPSRAFSKRLEIEVDSNNPYNGALGVFWPNQESVTQTRMLPRHFFSTGNLVSELQKLLKNALASLRTDSECTWQHMKELMARDRINALKSTNSREVEQYIEAFDEELNAKNEKLEIAEKQIHQLRGELASLQRAREVRRSGFLKPPQQQELYDDEFLDAILFALEKSKTAIYAKGRMREIIDLTMGANSSDQGGVSQRDLLQEEIKSILSAGNNLDFKSQKALEKMGFSFSDDGKHRKMLFREDERYAFVLPKSGSDHRGGKNLVSDITQKLFK